MLAKQGWRLTKAPESLCARVLKAKSFPACFFLFWKRRSWVGLVPFVYMEESAQLKGRFSIRESSVALGAACR